MSRALYLTCDCSIICIPAISADARTTWSRKGEDGIGWLGLLQSKLPSANLLLYDHLKPEERRLELRDARDAVAAKEFTAAEEVLASYGVEDYADRFHATVEQYRRTSGVCASQPFKGIFSGIDIKLITPCAGGATTNYLDMPQYWGHSRQVREFSKIMILWSLAHSSGGIKQETGR